MPRANTCRCRIADGRSAYETDGVKTRAFWDAVLAKVRQLPGVTEVAMDDRVPMYYDWEDAWQFSVDGQPLQTKPPGKMRIGPS
jgi:hypothetical protein